MSRENDHNAKQLAFRLTLGLRGSFSPRSKEELVRLIKRWPEKSIADFYETIESLWKSRDESEETLAAFKTYCEKIYPVLIA